MRYQELRTARKLMFLLVGLTSLFSLNTHALVQSHNGNEDKRVLTFSYAILPSKATKPGKGNTTVKAQNNQSKHPQKIHPNAKKRPHPPPPVDKVRFPTTRQPTANLTTSSASYRALKNSVSSTRRTLRPHQRNISQVNAKQHPEASRHKNLPAWLPKDLHTGKIVSRGEAARMQLGKLRNGNQIRQAFKGEIMQITLTRPLVVHRRSSKQDNDKGNWFSTRQYLSGSIARRFLSLPKTNQGTRRNSFIIPRGTTLYIGKAAGQQEASWAGPYATGGGVQIYAPKVGKIKKL